MPGYMFFCSVPPRIFQGVFLLHIRKQAQLSRVPTSHNEAERKVLWRQVCERIEPWAGRATTMDLSYTDAYALL